MIGTEFRPSRVVNLSSDGHKFTMKSGLDVDAPGFGSATWGQTFKGMTAFHQLYGQSKLAQIYHAKEISCLARKAGKNVVAVSCHPGAVNTEITRHHNEGFFTFVTSTIEGMLCIFGKTAEEGAQTTLHCCLTDSSYLEPGGYYVDCALAKLNDWYHNDRHQVKLRELSDKLLGLEPTDAPMWTKIA